MASQCWGHRQAGSRAAGRGAGSEGTRGLAWPAERGSDGSNAPARRTRANHIPAVGSSAKRARPLRAPGTREGDRAKPLSGPHRPGRREGAGVRGRGGSALPTCTVGSSCVHRCPVFPARWPLPGLHVKPLRSLEGSGPSPETSMYLAWGGAGHAGRSLTAAQVSLMGSLDEPVAQLGALPKPGRLTRGPGWDPGSGFHQVPSDAEAAPHAEVLGPKQAWARDCLRAAGRGACPERQAVCWAKAWDPG